LDSRISALNQEGWVREYGSPYRAEGLGSFIWKIFLVLKELQWATGGERVIVKNELAVVEEEFDETMNEPLHTGDKMFRLCFETVEAVGIGLVALCWVLTLTAVLLECRWDYEVLFHGGLPVMIVVAVSGLLTWRGYRKHALIQFGVLIVWGIWAFWLRA
jgi:hypothetical protein